MTGNDVCLLGSGKTAAFLIPILCQIFSSGIKEGKKFRPDSVGLDERYRHVTRCSLECVHVMTSFACRMSWRSASAWQFIARDSFRTGLTNTEPKITYKNAWS